MNKDTFDLLLDSMERNNMRLTCGDRKMSAQMMDGKYYFEVWSMPKFQRGPKWHYKGNDFYAAMLALEGENPS